MTSTYTYAVTIPITAALLTLLDTRINQDPNMPDVSSPSIGLGGSDVQVFFAAALTDPQAYLLFTFIQNIFFGAIAGETYTFNNRVFIPRSLNKVNYTPTGTDDLLSGYNSSSVIYNTTTPAVYTCVDNTLNTAKWFRTDNVYNYVFAVNNGLTGPVPNAGSTAINPVTIVTSFNNATTSWAFDGSGRLVIPTTGTYNMAYSMQFASTTAVNITAVFRKNGTTFITGSARSIRTNTTGPVTLEVYDVISDFVANDFIQIVLQASGANSTFNATTAIAGVTVSPVQMTMTQIR